MSATEDEDSSCIQVEPVKVEPDEGGLDEVEMDRNEPVALKVVIEVPMRPSEGQGDIQSTPNSQECALSNDGASCVPSIRSGSNNIETTTSNSDCDPMGSSLELLNRLRTAEEEVHRVRRDAQSEIDFWKAEFWAANRERVKLNRSKAALMVKLGNLREEGRKFSIADFVESQATIDRLLDDRDARKGLHDLQQQDDVQTENDCASWVFGLMEGIHDRLAAILKNVETADSVELHQLPQDHTLRVLVDQAFGSNEDSTMALEALEKLREKSWWQQYGLLTLCGAAIARWVFQQSQDDILFDRLQHAGTRGSSSRYRDAIKLVRLQSSPPSLRLRVLD